MLDLCNEITSINDKHIVQLLILGNACDIILAAMLLLLVAIRVVAFSQLVDRPFAHSIVHHVHCCTANGECVYMSAHESGAYCCVLALLTLAVAVMVQVKIR